jgi:hypothetical protein
MQSSLTEDHRKMLCEWIMNEDHVDVAVVVVHKDGASMGMMSSNVTGQLKARLREATKSVRPRARAVPC